MGSNPLLTHRWETGAIMLILTGAVLGTLILVAAVGRIWRDRTPREPEDKPGD